MTVNLEMKCSSFFLLLTMTDPNPYRVDGFYDNAPKQSPLERIILEQFKKLNWEMDDDISIEIAGSQVYEIEGDGTRWKPNKGTVKYNKDAFIVIKNRDRNPYVPSVAPPVVSEETVTMGSPAGRGPPYN